MTQKIHEWKKLNSPKRFLKFIFVACEIWYNGSQSCYFSFTSNFLISQVSRPFSA